MPYQLLFDIGKVILEFDFERAINRVAPQCSKRPDYDSLRDEIDPLETGAISVDQFLDRVSDKLGYSGDKPFLLSSFQDIFTLNEPMVEVIKAESQRGIPLYILSNTSAVHVPYINEKYSVFNYFDQPVYSFEVELMKPDPDIYHATTNTLSLDPAKTIYIDDRPENIVGGKEHGYHSILYDIDDHAGFLQQFEAAKAVVISSA